MLVRAVHALLAIIVQVGWQLEFAQLDSILQEAGDHVETALEAFIHWRVQVDALLVELEHILAQRLEDALAVSLISGHMTEQITAPAVYHNPAPLPDPRWFLSAYAMRDSTATVTGVMYVLITPTQMLAPL